MEIDGAEVPDNVELVDFEDYDKRRQLMFDKAKDTLAKQFPREHNGVRMKLTSLEYADPERYSIDDQYNALKKDTLLSRRLRGNIVLEDAKTGEKLDEKTLTLMHVPYLTNRGTFVNNGNELGTSNQQRLIPGAYSRFQNNGELETQFNVRPGTGGAFKVQFNPETAVYRFSIAGSNLPLYSLLRAIGVSDDELKERWGEEVFAANAEKYDASILDKAYAKIVPTWERKNDPSPTTEKKIAKVKDALNKAQVSTAVLKKTLPNMFSREKAAAWKNGGEMMEKMASVTKQDVMDIINYLNAAADADLPVDPSMSVEQMIANIRAFITTGLLDGDVSLGKMDYANEAATAVRMQRAAAAMARLNKQFH